MQEVQVADEIARGSQELVHVFDVYHGNLEMRVAKMKVSVGDRSYHVIEAATQDHQGFY